VDELYHFKEGIAADDIRTLSDSSSIDGSGYVEYGGGADCGKELCQYAVQCKQICLRGIQG